MYNYPEKIKSFFKDTLPSLKMLLFWVIAGTVTGGAVGITGVGFHYAIDIFTEIRMENRFVIFFLPIGGLLIAWLYHIAGMDKDKGTNAVILAVREDENIPFRTSVLIFVSTVITHFLGGSSGREGAALQIGGSLAAAGGRIFKINDKEKKIIIMAGMSACFSALFGTPVTAAMFSIEVISVGIMHYSAIVPCVMASLTAFRISELMGVVPTSFSIRMAPEFGEYAMFKIIPFAVACALVCRFFCFSVHRVKHMFAQYIENRYLRVLAGSVMIIIMTLISGDQTFNGAGGQVIVRNFAERAPFYMFFVKIIFTAVTLGCGFKGGEIVPAFFIGSAFGSFASEFFGINYSFGAGIGLIAVFCGATNCPTASLLMSIELFGIDSLPFFALVCGVSYLISGDTGLYSEQKIMYSRTMPEFVNKTLKGKKNAK